MFGIVQHGSEWCEHLPGKALVVVHVPVRITGEGPVLEANLRHRIGASRAPGPKLLLFGQQETTLTFRISQESFQPPELLSLEAYVKSTQGEELILWTQRYEVGWRDEAHRLQPFVQLAKEQR